MAGVDRHLIQLWNHTIDAKGLIPQLAGFDHLIAEAHIRLYRLCFRALKGQILTGHIAVLAIWRSHLVPAGRGFVQHNDLAALFVFAEDFVVRPRSGAQMQRPALCGDLVYLNIIGAGLVLLRDQPDAGRHGGRHRRAENAALRKPHPLAALVNVVYQRELPFAIQGFVHCAGHGRDHAEAVAGEVRAVSRIDTDQTRYLQFG